MTTGFEQAAYLGSVDMFKQCLEMGLDHSREDFFRRTPIFGLRLCRDASVEEFVGVLRAFIEAGANIDHVDSFGDTLLLMTDVDNLGAALVQVGARVSYDWTDFSKRGLANAVMYGCTRTISAIMHSRANVPAEIRQQELDSCLDQGAKTMSFNPQLVDMSGVIKMVVEYGANPNKWSTLHHCVKRNHSLVSTLISLGARPGALAWDFRRGVKNTPLHRLTEVVSFDVFHALVSASAGALDVNARDSSGATPLMALMKTRELLASKEALKTRFDWLMDRGASCLPVDSKGRRVAEMLRSSDPPFKELIAARLKEEYWQSRKGLVLLRAGLLGEEENKRKRKTRGVVDSLVVRVARFRIDGIFRNIVVFL